MKKLLIFCTVLLMGVGSFAQGEDPLRVFIRSGPKTHGPGEHDHPKFMENWVKLLNERGAKATGKQGFPTAEELEKTDVLVMYLAEGGTIQGQDRTNLEKFLARGGGIVTLHDAICGNDPQWFKGVVGGAWEHGHSKWHEGIVGSYFIDTEHPITRGVSNFDFDDEIYYDLQIAPEANILATSFHSVFVIGPQMWTYEKDDYRSFVWLAGHKTASFELPQVRALILRGIAWAGKRENVDALCSQEELGSLKYPEGGPIAPEKAVATMNVHPEFEMNLVAAEPLVEKAISMDWDPQGRIWIAETPEYPSGRTINRNDEIVSQWEIDHPGEPLPEKEDRPARDRISWIEDTNGDGVADKKHVFADGLELVTSLVFYKDGVIVAQAPDILWLRDKDGDGKCNMQDERVVLYTGFGTFDTHAVINNFRWGMDGWIYGAIGYSAGNPVSPDGKDFGRVTAGVIRFKPDGSALEQHASGSCNTWGFDVGPDGELFYTTATCGEHFLHIVMPEKILAKGNIGGVRSSAVLPDHQEIKPAVKHTRPAYVQIDWVGKFTAAAGCCIYNGGAWPDRYDGSHFCSETTMSLVHNELLKPNGVTFTAVKEPGREETEFVAGTDLWFRPIHTRVGPDGALYVIDFYNQAAIHNDTRGPKHGARNAAVRPDRDHHFSRIWRIQHKNARKLDGWSFKNQADLVKALNHPNGWVRQTAQRLLVERGDQGAVAAIQKLAASDSTSPLGKVHALWAAYLLSGKHNPELMASLYGSKNPAVAKAVMQLLRNYPVPAGESAKFEKLYAAMKDQMKNAEGRLRLETVMAISAADDAGAFGGALWNAYASLDDPWTESALVSVFARDPAGAILAAADLQNPAAAQRTVRELANRLANGNDANAAAALLVKLAGKPASANPLKQAVLESFARTLKEDAVARWTPELGNAFRAFLKADEAVATAALPLIARWDEDATMTAELKPVIEPLLARLGERRAGVDARAQTASGLLGLRKLDSRIVPALVDVLTGENPVPLKRRVAETLGSVSDEAVGKALVKAYNDLQFELRDPVFAQITKRPESTRILLEAIQRREIPLGQLGPALVHRLRTHPDASLANRAIEIVDEIRGPETKEKDALIEQFAAAVEKPGNLEKGRELFTVNCATCHKYKGEGSDLAPDLTGMGAHGPHDLLVHIVDPNRVVEPNFATVSIETKDELSYDGIVTRENQNTLVMRNATGEFEIRKADIASRRATGMSLMPNGFESLGEEGLRDLITYLTADENKFRIVDLTPAFTVDSTRGIYSRVESENETLRFRKFGLVTVDDVPFDIIHPSRTPAGKNLIVLKGGSGYARTLPQKVEAPVNAKANRLHFLGGVAGWGYPWGGEDNKGVPIAKVTVHFKDGAKKELVLKNGEEFADYIGKYDVPASKEAQNLLRSGQVRWFTKDLGREGVIEKLTLESYNNNFAPTFVAITAEVGEGPVAESTPTAAKKVDPNAIRTLIVGGNSAHNFGRWFGEEDTKILERDGLASVEYTEDISSILPKLPELDVLYLSNNQPMEDPKLREAIFKFVEAGKGLVLVHAALWYNHKDWPEYNTKLAGGGSRGHDRFQEIELNVVKPEHPVMKGVPATSRFKDELYWVEVESNGSPMEVLATAHLPNSEKTFRNVWISKYRPNSRIVCIAIGHDGESHNHPTYQAILRNAVKWAAGKQ